MPIQRKTKNKLIQSLMASILQVIYVYFIFIFCEKYDYGTARRFIPAKMDGLIKQQTTSQMNE